MKIRSITYFCNPKYRLDEKVIQAAGEFLAKAKSAYEAAAHEGEIVRGLVRTLQYSSTVINFAAGKKG